MVDIDEILAAAIRTALLQADGPAPRSHHRIEVETARRVRAVLEGEGVIITQAHPMPEVAPRPGAPLPKTAGGVVFAGTWEGALADARYRFGAPKGSS